MKFLRQSFLLSLFLLLVTGACTVEKRIYRSGYHVHWNKGKHRPSKPVLVKNASSKQTQPEKAREAPQITNSSLRPSEQTTTNENMTTAAGKRLFPTKRKFYSLNKQQTIFKPHLTSTRKKMKPENEKTPLTEETLNHRKSILSTLWIFVTLNYLYCDVAGLMDAAMLTQYLAGIVDGFVISAEFLLAAGILMEIPIAMVLLSRILNRKGNRTANIVAGIIMTCIQIATLFAGPVASYYLFFSIIEIATTVFITWYAWRKMA